MNGRYVTLGRFMYWTPRQVDRPWLPRYWLGCDEYHNKAISIVVPFLGAFHWFYGVFERNTAAYVLHDSLQSPGCTVCQELQELE